MQANVIDPCSDPRWDAFVEKHPHGHVFHHSAWKRVLEETFHHIQPYYLVAEEEDRLLGAVPFFFVRSWLTGRRLISLPFSFYSDPLMLTGDCLETFLKAILPYNEERGGSFIQFRVRHTDDVFRSAMFHEFPGFKNHILYLDEDLDRVYKSFHRTCVRQRIQRAEKSGVTVREAAREEDVRTFYRLHCMTRHKYGVPPQPYAFFLNIWKVLRPERMVNVYTAFHEGNPISSLICLNHKSTVHAEYMGTDDRYNRYSGNVLLFWHAIREAKRADQRAFEFGSSSVSEQALIDYKRRWGTEEEDISYYYHPRIEGFSSNFANSRKYSILSWISRKLPDPLFVSAGRALYHHLGG